MTTDNKLTNHENGRSEDTMANTADREEETWTLCTDECPDDCESDHKGEM